MDRIDERGYRGGLQQPREDPHGADALVELLNGGPQPCCTATTLPGADVLLAEAMGCISLENKEEYLEAVQKCPNLVVSDSPAEVYLRATESDALQAARKRALYWKLRKACLGGYEAFLPIPTEGATSNAVQSIGKGFVYDAVTKDSRGRGVFIFNRHLLTACPEDDRIRCTFYYSHCLAQDPEAQRNGAIILDNRMVSYPPNYSKEGNRLGLQVLEALPLCVETHVITDEHSSIVNHGVLPPLALEESSVRENTCAFLKGLHWHHNLSSSQLIDFFRQIGLRREHYEAMFVARVTGADPKIELIPSTKRSTGAAILPDTKCRRAPQHQLAFCEVVEDHTQESRSTTPQQQMSPPIYSREKKKPGKRGKDTQKRKARHCYRCTIYGQGQNADRCSGRGKRELCEYYDEDGNIL